MCSMLMLHIGRGLCFTSETYMYVLYNVHTAAYHTTKFKILLEKITIQSKLTYIPQSYSLL
jgi:hypothetical protein